MNSYTIRATRRADAEAVTALINAHSIALVGVAEETPETILVSWDSPGFELANDSIVVELADGSLAATAEVWDVGDVHVRPWGFVRLHPAYQNQGLEDELLDWIERRAARAVALAPAEARVVLTHRLMDKEQAGGEKLLRRGYRLVRHSALMQMELAGAGTGAAEVAGGPRISRLEESNQDAAILALYEAFRDHWGALPETFSQYRERILHMFDYPEVSRELSLVALDGEEVVGATISSHGITEDPGMGWVNLLGVRRAWRKRGVGEALLKHSFAAFRAQGLERAGLAVDTESLTGATRLYEKVGLRVDRLYLTYEKELRAGKDLTVRELPQ